MSTITTSGPYTHKPSSVSNVMTLVLLALLPATAFNMYLFGWPAIFLFAVTIASCVAVEAGCLMLAGKPIAATLKDNSAVLTGWLMAASIPPWAPWWVGFIGALFAIALTKHAFGGLGQNLFNPAMVGRTVMLISFPVAMTAWVAPHPMFSADAPGISQSLSITFGHGVPDTMASASPLGYVKTELSRGVPLTESMAKVPELMDMALGYRSGSLGETSAILILLGGLFLMGKRIISWHTPVSVMGSLFLIAALFHAVDPARFASGGFHLFSGATFLGAFFIATDYVTSPVSKTGQLIFGAGVGLLTWCIRNFAGYPEGMAFAILLMNSLTPIIDQYTRPRIFGRDHKGTPLPVEEKP